MILGNRLNRQTGDSQAAIPVKLLLKEVSGTFLIRKGQINAIENISLEVKADEFICTVGPSGCGKSTLLNIIAGMEKPDRGQAFVNGYPH